ncbi:MAG: hypothetical protein PHN26_02115 [Eubacteriaceae bacterium]|nr:hypothetical protein [Eubacteriaceae bacterium]
MAAENKNIRLGLPYINNVKIVAMTLAINLLCVVASMAFHSVDLEALLTDAAFFGMITAIIDTFYIKRRVDQLARKGALPARVPQNRMMEHLPQNPLALALIIGMAFAVLTPVFNALLFLFFGFTSLSFPQFLVWRMVYTWIFSAKIVELCILRYTQNDYQNNFTAVQGGGGEVKDPMPHISTLKNYFHTITEDFGFNLVVGLVTGGTVISGTSVIIFPTTRSGIVISAVILGFLVCAQMVYPVSREIWEGVQTGSIPQVPEQHPWIAKLPASPRKFTLALILPVLGSITLILWSILTFFNLEALNFFQYFVIRTACVWLLTQGVVKLSILRFTPKPEKTVTRK